MMILHQRTEMVEGYTWSDRVFGGMDVERYVKTATNSPSEGVQKV